MANEVWKINSITMSMDTFNIVARGQGSPVALKEVLKLIEQALDEKKPIYIEDSVTGVKYRLMEDRSLVEVK